MRPRGLYNIHLVRHGICISPVAYAGLAHGTGSECPAAVAQVDHPVQHGRCCLQVARIIPGRPAVIEAHDPARGDNLPDIVMTAVSIFTGKPRCDLSRRL